MIRIATKRQIASELARHAPFTATGALTGIAIMAAIIFAHVPSSVSATVFYVLHPLHIALSAIVTTGMYRKHGGKAKWAFLVGYVGTIGPCTLSDVILPYLGGTLVGAKMELDICFIEEWWLVNPAALAGIAIGYWRTITRLPHYGHVLLSTWASLFYLAAFGVANWLPLLVFVFPILFVAVWLPCCFSDIVFPLLFVRDEHQRRQLSLEHADH